MKREGLSAHLDPLDWLVVGTTAPDKRTAWSRFEKQLVKLGADSVGVVFEMPKTFGTFPTPDEMFGHFINPEWHAFYYDNQDLVRHDVMARYLFRSTLPQFVDADDPSTIPAAALTDKERAFLDLAKDFGLQQTTGMSFFDRAAGRLSIVMANRSAGGAGDMRELAANHMSEFHLAAQFFVEGLRLRDLKHGPHARRLSPQETDCLHWAAVGYSTKEIADIMALADATVNEYFTSAKRKLRAANRVQAVTRAHALGLISP